MRFVDKSKRPTSGGFTRFTRVSHNLYQDQTVTVWYYADERERDCLKTDTDRQRRRDRQTEIERDRDKNRERHTETETGRQTDKESK